jgi:PIN domain nuclease of toxin-antitoxin system
MGGQSLENPKLGPQAVTALQDPGNDLLLSAGTIWEIAIKVGLGSFPVDAYSSLGRRCRCKRGVQTS